MAALVAHITPSLPYIKKLASLSVVAPAIVPPISNTTLKKGARKVKRSGPNRTEPNRSGPNRTEPKRSGPNRTESNRSELNRSASVRFDPNRSGQNKSVRSEFNRNDPNQFRTLPCLPIY